VTLPSVSVIVPCYRYASLLGGCVQSVLAQAGVEPRILIIDDCSPDDTAVVGQRLAAAHPAVEYHRNAQNLGLIATANEGLRRADGDYVMLLSADDLLVPDALRRATTVMSDNPDVGMVYGRPLYAYPEQPLPTVTGHWRATDTWAGAEWIRLRCRSGYNCISSPEAVVRTSVQRQVGGYDPACVHASDLNMWLRIAAVSDVAYVRGVAQAIYRIHPGSMLRSQSGPIEDLRERRVAFDSFFAQCGPLLADGQHLQETAGRALARQALWRASRTYARGLVADPQARDFDELVAFAQEVCPDVRGLREWRGLALRRRLGSRHSRWFPPFLATGAAHRLHNQLMWRRWRVRGV